MLRVEQYDVAVRDLRRKRDTSKSDDERVGWDQAWSDMLTARNHANLVSRFDEQSAAARNEAARLSGRPGAQRMSEAARERSNQLHEIAERHRKAAEEKQEQSETMIAEMSNGNGQNGSGEAKEQNGRRRSDRRQAHNAEQRHEGGRHGEHRQEEQNQE